MQIIGNSIGSNNTTNYIGNRGIRVGNADNVTVLQNTIFNFNNSSTTIQTTGIEFSTNTINSTISRNLIYGLEYTGTTNRAGQGISISTVAAANITVSNNVIHTLKGHSSATALNNSWGIMLLAGGDINVYFNSISQSYAFGGTATNIHGGIYLAASLTNLNIVNNTINNTSTTGLLYNVYCLSANTAFTSLNYNIYYYTGSNNVGYIGSTAYPSANFAGWQTASLEGANSSFVDPLFNSNTNLSPQIGSPLTAVGNNSTGITIDYNGVNRTNPPTIGAYDVPNDGVAPVITYTALSGTCLSTNITLTANITDVSGVPTA